MKIYGTKTENESGENLCLTCNNSSRIKTSRHELLLCHQFGLKLRERVLECTKYDDARLLSVDALEEKAYRWVGGKINKFLSPMDYRRLNMFGAAVISNPVDVVQNQANIEDKETIN